MSKRGLSLMTQSRCPTASFAEEVRCGRARARTRRSWSALWVSIAAGLLSIGFAGCANPDRDPVVCPRREPAFRLLITAGTEALPADTELIVHYGGANSERYDFSNGNGDNEDVCCVSSPSSQARWLSNVGCLRSPAVRDAARQGPDAEPPDPSAPLAIQCELNTNGAARVEIHASGYAALDRTLSAQRSTDEALEHCNALTTRDVLLELERGDAGAVLAQ